jgi:hypothetical protein
LAMLVGKKRETTTEFWAKLRKSARNQQRFEVKHHVSALFAGCLQGLMPVLLEICDCFDSRYSQLFHLVLRL